MTKSVHIYSFFAGSGFLDLGFENSGYEIVFVNEIHEPFLNAYIYSRERLGGKHPLYGYHNDCITTFLAEEDNRFLAERIKSSRSGGNLVGFIAGPPCPDFSVGGKNRGRTGDKGRLSEAYLELVRREQPDFFLFENVKGLWRTRKHREFYEEIKQTVIEKGYITTERLINAIEYGVPQDRDRIILIGFRKESFEELYKKTNSWSDQLLKSSFPWTRYASYIKEQVFNLSWPGTSPFVEDSTIASPGTLPLELTVEHWFKRNNVEHHLNSEHAFKPRAGLSKFMSIQEGDVSKKSFKRLHRWRYSPTAAYGNNEVHIHPYKPRRISAAEALAIQSLPEDFVLPHNMTLSAMFKTIGNGVPYLAAKAIAQAIFDYIENPDEETNHDRISSYNQRFTTQPFLLLRESVNKDTYRISSC